MNEEQTLECQTDYKKFDKLHSEWVTDSILENFCKVSGSALNTMVTESAYSYKDVKVHLFLRKPGNHNTYMKLFLVLV